MAFPLDFFENFEAGTKGSFDSETDTGNRLDFPHAHDIAPAVPWRGAYCCRVNLGKSSTNAYLEEGVSWSNAGTWKYGRLRVFVGKDVQFGNDGDYVRLLAFYSGTSTFEGALTLARVEPFGIALVTDSGTGSTFTDNGLLVDPGASGSPLSLPITLAALIASSSYLVQALHRLLSISAPRAPSRSSASERSTRAATSPARCTSTISPSTTPNSMTTTRPITARSAGARCCSRRAVSRSSGPARSTRSRSWTAAPATAASRSTTPISRTSCPWAPCARAWRPSLRTPQRAPSSTASASRPVPTWSSRHESPGDHQARHRGQQPRFVIRWRPTVMGGQSRVSIRGGRCSLRATHGQDSSFYV